MVDDKLNSNNNVVKERYFKCMYNGQVYNRVKGTELEQAAFKAFCSLMKHKKRFGEICDEQKLNFSLIECTKGNQ